MLSLSSHPGASDLIPRPKSPLSTISQRKDMASIIALLPSSDGTQEGPQNSSNPMLQLVTSNYEDMCREAHLTRIPAFATSIEESDSMQPIC